MCLGKFGKRGLIAGLDSLDQRFKLRHDAALAVVANANMALGLAPFVLLFGPLKAALGGLVGIVLVDLACLDPPTIELVDELAEAAAGGVAFGSSVSLP